MHVQVMDEFFRLTAVADAKGFDDSKLTKLGKQCSMKKEAVAHFVARQLLLLFPSHAQFLFQSPTLKREYQFLSRLYDQVIQAFFGGKDPYQLPGVWNIFSQYSYRAQNQRALIEDAKNDAKFVHEYLLTFPDWYGLSMPSNHQEADALIHLIDFPVDTPYPAQAQDLTRIFFKRIALFVDGNPMNWDQASSRWITEGGNQKKLERFIPYFVKNRIFFRNPPSPSKVKSQLFFKEFLIEKTICEFEKKLGIQFEGPTRSELQEECQDENIRMNLVFVTGNLNALQTPLDPSKPGYKWLRAAQKYFLMNEHWEIDDQRKPLVFQWCIKAPSENEAPIPSTRQPFLLYWLGVTSLGNQFLGKDWERGALELLNVLKDVPLEQIENVPGQFVFNHNTRPIKPMSVRSFCAFLRGGYFLQDRSHQLGILSRFLESIKAQSSDVNEDESPLYLTLLYEDWDQKDIAEAQGYIQGKVTIERALQILQNVAVKNRVEAFVGVPLPQEHSRTLLDSNNRKDGVITSLNRLFALLEPSVQREEILLEIGRLSGVDRSITDFLETRVAQFPFDLLTSSSFLPYGDPQSFARVGCGMWTFSERRSHFHFCFGRVSDGNFVYKKVTFKNEKIIFDSHGPFLDYLQSRCQDKLTPMDNHYSCLEGDIQQFIADLEEANLEAIRDFGKTNECPPIRTGSRYPASFKDAQGTVTCQYDQMDDSCLVTMTSQKKTLSFVVPRTLSSHHALRWQLFLVRKI